jgi:hypothetical protein
MSSLRAKKLRIISAFALLLMIGGGLLYYKSPTA